MAGAANYKSVLEKAIDKDTFYKDHDAHVCMGGCRCAIAAGVIQILIGVAVVLMGILMPPDERPARTEPEGALPVVYAQPARPVGLGKARAGASAPRAALRFVAPPAPFGSLCAQAPGRPPGRAA